MVRVGSTLLVRVVKEEREMAFEDNRRQMVAIANGASMLVMQVCVFFFSSRRRHTRCLSDWSSDVCSSDLTANRKDFSIAPIGTTLLDLMADAGIVRIGIGKVDDLFAGRNISSQHTPTNADAYRRIEQALDTLETGFVFVNVIEFDQTWGHRNDVPGFHQGLKELDAWIPRLLPRLQPDDLA